MLSPDDPIIGKAGVAYPQYGGFAVETQVSIDAACCVTPVWYHCTATECMISGKGETVWTSAAVVTQM